MTISTNFQRNIAEPEISYGRALIFFLSFLFFFTDKMTRVGGLTHGLSGKWKHGYVFFFFFFFFFFTP